MLYLIIHALSGQTLHMFNDKEAAQKAFNDIIDVDGIVFLVECTILERKGGID